MTRKVPVKGSPEEKGDPYAEGYEAAMCGAGDLANPYDIKTDTHLSWNDGYNAAMEDMEKDS
jgi:ribosome modulation factor